MNNQRITPNSKAGRQLNQVAKSLQGTLTPAQVAWNKAVDEKKSRRPPELIANPDFEQNTLGWRNNV